GFTGGYLQVQRYLQPLRAARQWAAVATMRFETAPGAPSRPRARDGACETGARAGQEPPMPGSLSRALLRTDPVTNVRQVLAPIVQAHFPRCCTGSCAHGRLPCLVLDSGFFFPEGVGVGADPSTI